MPGELPILSMYRHEVLRPDQRKHELQLFLAPMARYMYVLVAFGNHFGIAPRNVVHHAANRLFVPGNLAG